ncbi:hypothetical protein BDR06DRAFT_967843 [Suillus hirtellus]|nr:hypothetical protein BDR06DRAFT_967843 [Suillus hirtellus]
MPDFVPGWSATYQKAKNFISDYTIEEKVNITTGVGWVNSWNHAPIPVQRYGQHFDHCKDSFLAGYILDPHWTRGLMDHRDEESVPWRFLKLSQTRLAVWHRACSIAAPFHQQRITEPLRPISSW